MPSGNILKTFCTYLKVNTHTDLNSKSIWKIYDLIELYYRINFYFEKKAFILSVNLIYTYSLILHFARLLPIYSHLDH